MGANQIILKNAFKIVSGIILYFLLMKILGLDEVVELRYLNFLFVFWGINSAVKTNIKVNDEVFYIRNFFIGVSTAMIAVGFIVASLIFYVSVLDPNFISLLEDSYFWGSNLSLPLVVIAITIEGIGSSVVCAYIIMQYWKNYKISSIPLKS